MARYALLFSLSLLVAACAGHTGHMAHGDHGQGQGARAESSPIPWQSLADGKTMALAEKKPMIVDFYVPEGCGRCERMAQYVWSNPEIAQAVTRDFVPVRIDLSRNMSREEIALGKKYDYKYDCLLVFLDSRGNVIEDLSGKRLCFADFVEPEWFIAYLNRAREVNTQRLQ